MKNIIVSISIAVLTLIGVTACDEDHNKPRVYRDANFDIAIICVEGHVMYTAHANVIDIKGIAMKLDDNGKPIKCEGEMK